MKVQEHTKFHISHVYEIKRLRLRDHRAKTGCVIVEGYAEVKRAIEANTPITQLFLCPEILEDKLSEFDSHASITVTKEEFKQIAFGHRLKGILAVCKPEIATLKTIKLKENPFILVLEGVEKPGNLGTIIRSCDGAGVDAVLCCDQKTDIFNQHVVRSSIGSLFHVPTIACTKEDAVKFLKENNITIVGTTAHTTVSYSDYNFLKASAIVMGNEHEGISKYFHDNLDGVIKIPMQGVSSSLNVAVSASIIIFEVNRQRNGV